MLGLHEPRKNPQITLSPLRFFYFSQEIRSNDTKCPDRIVSHILEERVSTPLYSKLVFPAPLEPQNGYSELTLEERFVLP